ncbi:DUF4367 domain-containing protein [Bacillus salitolerans]|uniref:DUF4367 domain-containing protein n=1 Tax=Bacillus salitolerans TaxID=1437434 RepID=A0ABW4LR66_9BACI
MLTHEDRFEKALKTRKILSILLGLFIILGIFFSVVRLPIQMASWFVPFDVSSPTYLPIQSNNHYAKVSLYNRVKMIFENENERVTVWVTSQIGWHNVSSWDEQTRLLDGTTAYYQENEHNQMLSWRINDVEYSIVYEGPSQLSKEEMMEMAMSFR